MLSWWAPLTRLIAWMQFMPERVCQQFCQHEVPSHVFHPVAARFRAFRKPLKVRLEAKIIYAWDLTRVAS
jgi:hypothetical protein